MPDSTSSARSLNERRRLQTRDEIAAVAIQLFNEVGFEETSMVDIASHSEVSRRTVYRHFATKADLVFEHPRRWLEHFTAVLASDPSVENTQQRCERAIRELAAIVDADPVPVLEAFAVRNANPELGATHTASDAAWAEQIFTHLVAEHGEGQLLPCMICAGSFVGATNALILAWSLGQPELQLVDMVDGVLTQCAGLWPTS